MSEIFRATIGVLILMSLGGVVTFLFIIRKYEVFPKGTEDRIHRAIKDAFKDGMVMLSCEISIKTTQHHMEQAWMWSTTETWYRNIRRLFR